MMKLAIVKDTDYDFSKSVFENYSDLTPFSNWIEDLAYLKEGYSDEYQQVLRIDNKLEYSRVNADLKSFSFELVFDSESKFFEFDTYLRTFDNDFIYLQDMNNSTRVVAGYLSFFNVSIERNNLFNVKLGLLI